MKKKIASLIVIMILIVGVTSTTMADVGWQTVSGEEWEPITRTTWLGVLKGSWHEMGFQYGERAAYDIRANTDLQWSSTLSAIGGSSDELKRRIAVLKEQLELFSPETIKFIQGIADGAAPQLNNSPYATSSSNFERIFNFSASNAVERTFSSRRLQ